MDICAVKWTRLQSEIFRLLCIKSGQNLNLRSIARLLKRSPTAISNALQLLEKGKLVKIKRTENINMLFIELNRENQDAINLKRVENLKQVYESGLAKFLHNNFPGTTIILFGSYSRGEDILNDEHKSDIDIAIIGTKGKEANFKEFNKLLGRIIFINFYSSFKKIHKNLKDSILNGIILSGSIDL